MTSDLAARYASWDAQELVRAATLESAEYTPEALELIRKELEKREISPDERTDMAKETVQDERRRFIGVKGLLALFIVLLALQSAWLGLTALGTLPSLTAILEGLFAGYGMVVCVLLINRHRQAPRHAKTLLVLIILLAVADAWLSISTGDKSMSSAYPVAAILGPCLWWTYFTTSRRVRYTYGGTEGTTVDRPELAF